MSGSPSIFLNCSQNVSQSLTSPPIFFNSIAGSLNFLFVTFNKELSPSSVLMVVSKRLSTSRLSLLYLCAYSSALCISFSSSPSRSSVRSNRSRISSSSLFKSSAFSLNNYISARILESHIPSVRSLDVISSSVPHKRANAARTTFLSFFKISIVGCTLILKQGPVTVAKC